MRWFVPTGLVLVLFSVSSGLADEGRIPVFEAGTIIEEPGAYVVTRDLSGTGSLIEIRVDGVTLDLGGFTLSTTAVMDDAVELFTPGGPKGVTIKNGRIQGGLAGIYMDAMVRTTVTIEDVEISGCGDAGIYLRSAAHVRISRCRISGTGRHGILVEGVSAPYTGSIEDNVIEGVAQDGIDMGGLKSGIVRRNVITNFGTNAAVNYGIFLYGGSAWDAGGNIVELNSIRSGGTGDHGIATTSDSPDNIIARNQVSRVPGSGIRISSNGNQVANNVVAVNGTGLYVAGLRNLIEGNQVQGNTGCGINFGSAGSHAYRNNMLRGNTGGTVCGSSNTDAGGNIL